MVKEIIPLESIVVEKGIQTGPFGSQLKAEEYTEVGVPVIMPKDIYDGNILRKSIARISEDKAKQLHKHRLKIGDILFPRRGDLGRIGIIKKENEDWVCGTGCLRVRLQKNVDSEYVHQYVQLISIKKWLERNALGQTMLNLNSEIIGSIPVYLPSIDEQKNISRLLPIWDEAIKNIKCIIEKKEIRFNFLLQSLINGNIYNQSWRKKKLNEIVKIKKGQQLSLVNMIDEGKYYVLNGGIVPSGYTDHWNTLENTVTISEGGNSCGYVNYNQEKFWAGGHCYSLLNVDNDIFNEFLFYVLKSREKEIMNLRVGTGLPNIQKKDIDNLIISFPSFEEQKHIAALLKDAQKEITVLKKMAEGYRIQKRGLMQKLLTGQWRLKTETD